MIELLLPMTLMFSNTHRSEGVFLPLTIAVTAIAVTAIAVTAGIFFTKESKIEHWRH